ncbi:MAG: 50S ribosome-binding GTPase [Candidatus Lokiarchaeota archaeon]|nr:50S ribosome-binding GTPase [Candidatus Lokiarchaeota archaeon]
MKNPFLHFYHVPNTKELLDMAFKRGMKSSAQVSQNAPILIKAKKKEYKRIKVAIEDIIERILNVIKSVPMIEELPDFYRELASLLVDVDELRLTLGKLNGILPILSQIERDSFRDLKKIEAPNEADRIRRAAFGRVSSILRKQNNNLEYLNNIRGKLRKIPSLDYEMPCVVFAGYPNVGKSSLVVNISTNKKINVQEYPFTTKELIIGHLHVERRFDTIRVQCMDTPGILDRPMSKRNNIEAQAILALRLISDLIIFVFDPTPACGYSIDSQIELYNEVKDNFTQDGKIAMLIILNKEDLASTAEINYIKEKLALNEEDFFITNALTGVNLDKVINYLTQKYENKS